jgi:ABC-type sugar transport system permease subunit
MKANNTGEANIKLVGKYFRLTFVFNALKTPLNLYLNSILGLFINFEIRGVRSFKTCLEGGNLVNLTMHAP